MSRIFLNRTWLRHHVYQYSFLIILPLTFLTSPLTLQANEDSSHINTVTSTQHATEANFKNVEESFKENYKDDTKVNNQKENRLISIISALLILQTILILVLQKGRIQYKRTRKELRSYHQHLEQRVIERTEVLNSLNNQLYKEISKHKATEALLQQTQGYLQNLINSMPSDLIAVTADGGITHWNTSAENSTTIPAEKALKMNIEAIHLNKAVTLPAIQHAIKHGKPSIIENVQEGAGSSSSYYDVGIYPLVSDDRSGAVIRVDDVTSRVKLENMMIQNEKMMALGELAAGLAHEINNPLSAILQGIQNIQRRTSPDLPANLEIAEKHNTNITSIRNYLEDRRILTFISNVQEAGERAAKIVSNVLEFSRSSNREYSLVDLRSLVNQSVELASSTFEFKTSFRFEEITITRDFSPELPKVPCSPIEIQQVILNLLRNASQAIALETPPIKSPSIIITLKHTEDSVIIEIADNGAGMEESVRTRIFEPFYTTKKVGQGTGLGLSVSYFIITEHHEGRIEVESTPGKGTRFIIYLPLLSPEELDPFT